MRGRFVTFEGVEGAGKSTQIAAAGEWLRDRGHDVVITREPGGTHGAEAIRDLLVRGVVEQWTDLSECLLVNAARSEHLDKLIRPALAAGRTVLCDRFMDSTRAYQGAAGGIDSTLLQALESGVVAADIPDLTLIFDLPVEAGLERARTRGSDDRFEQKGLDYHQRVRQAFRAIAEAEPARCRIIDAAGPPDRIGADVRAALASIADEERPS